MRGGFAPSQLLLPSPARITSYRISMVLAGEGFILKVHPEG